MGINTVPLWTFWGFIGLEASRFSDHRLFWNLDNDLLSTAPIPLGQDPGRLAPIDRARCSWVDRSLQNFGYHLVSREIHEIQWPQINHHDDIIIVTLLCLWFNLSLRTWNKKLIIGFDSIFSTFWTPQTQRQCLLSNHVSLDWFLNFYRPE